MIPIGDHGLACLSDTDPAAVALYMQDQALAIDAALDAISDDFDSFYLRPIFLGTTTAISGPNATLAEQLFPITSWSLTYSNFIPAPTTAASAGFRVTVPKTGWYNYGCYANLAATGAITANSRRSLYARATLRISGGATQLSQAAWRTVDTNTGGEHLVAGDGSFYATVGTTVDVEGYWSHANAASTVQVNTGAKIWCHFIGTGIEIGSA
jgi:hypothetical protein